MEKLKLPIIKVELLPPRPLSMDDYLKFVCDNLKTTVDIDWARKWKKESFVGVRFVLK